MEKYLSIGKFAKALGVTTQTVRNWAESGKVVPHHVTASGFRYYSQEQVYQYLGLMGKKSSDRVIVGYCRAESKKDKVNMVYQQGVLKSFMAKNGYAYEIVADYGADDDLNREVLLGLVERIMNGEIEKIITTTPDILSPLGRPLLEVICNKFGTEIIAIDNSEKN